MSMPDAAIAAIAAANGCALLTRNAADFAATGLHVINPWASEAAGTR
jgi:toxin FitB